ncbi:MAG: methyltransferase [Actinomycetota bacterium]|nr:methyltransferase [Actinomycetota bacterium]
MADQARVERIRRWHEQAYAHGKAEGRAEQTFSYLGTSLLVPPEVMPITGVSQLLGEAVLAEVRDGDRVLDMGTGCGVNAILAAATAREVVAVDINPLAVEAARRNAERNGLQDRLDVRESDVFSNVDGAFDLIVFDPPFRWFPPRDLLEVAMTDENYAAMTTFFREARHYLAPGGRLLIFFGTSGDLDYLQQLATEESFTSEVLAERDLDKDGWQVAYYTFRMTQTS